MSRVIICDQCGSKLGEGEYITVITIGKSESHYCGWRCLFTTASALI